MQSVLQFRRSKRNLEEEIRKHGLQKVASAACSGQDSYDRYLADVGPQPGPNSTGAAIDADANVRDYAFETNPESRHDRDPQAPSGPKEEDLEKPGRPSNDSSRSDETQSRDPDSIDVEKEAASTGDNTAHGQTTLNSDTETESSAGEPLRNTGTRLGRFLTGVSVKSRTKNEKREHYFVVDWQGPNDQLNPHNWSFARRMFYTFVVASIGLIVGVASSILSAAIPQASREFGVSEVVESLATGLYLVGFGFGAFFAAPMSETVGRNPIYLGTGVLFMVWTMASALAPNIGAQLVFQFLAGFFGSTPLTCAGGSISDMWTATERTATFPIFANSAFWGPILGPIVGGWIAQSPYLSWRWCEWITLIWAGVTFTIVALVLPETYAPVLLKWKAQHLRNLTKDQRYMSALEVQDTKFWQRLLHNFYTPWILVFTEPIVILFTLYLTVVYIVLFTFLTGFEFIFTDTYGLGQGLTFTIFVALGIGFLCGSILVPFIVKSYRRKLRQAQAEGHSSLPPERRLVFAMVCAPFLPLGLFWTAWTSYPSISKWSPIASMVPTGFAIIGIFISTYQYLIDAFESSAASALVGITFVRYVAAGGMIPVSIPFYENLGVHWTLTILGAISTIMVPVPYIFFTFGEKIRGKSRHAVGRR